MIRLRQYLRMLPISFTVTPILKDHLAKIDAVRRELLLTVFNPAVFMRLVWEARCERLISALSLAGYQTDRRRVRAMLLQSPDGDRTQGTEFFLHRYKELLATLHTVWLAREDEATVPVLRQLATRLRLGQEVDRLSHRITRAFSYMQSGNDHPVIQAGIVCMLGGSDNPTSPSWLIGRIASFLLLYRYGYNCRELPIWERWWWEKRAHISDVVRACFKEERATVWLETYASGMLEELESTRKKLAGVHVGKNTDDPLFHLTSRQQQIVYLFDRPEVRITNRNIQKKFGVSQITSSRDLVKLARLGLLFPHGKGRSVYYTRV